MYRLPVLPDGRLEQRIPEAKPAYSEAEAVTEANRCLYCVDAPCIKACPTEIDIPTFIRKISTGNVKGAARTILNENILGYSCARVCPVEVLCAGACVYNTWNRPPIQIGRLQRYATESALKQAPMATLLPKKKPASGKQVALIGAGPASVAAAGLLALEGHKAVIFERKPVPGGLNTLGIAPYKLLGTDALNEIDWVRALGDIELRTGLEVVSGEPQGGQVSTEALARDFDAVFVGLGLGADTRLSVPGEDGPGVYGAVELIERIKAERGFSLGEARCALIIGGGNTAIDIAHELKLLGVNDVAMVYRRGEADMSGYVHELEAARKHGVRLMENRVVASFERDGSGKLLAAWLQRADGGRGVPGSEERVAVDLVALAIGQNRATEIARAFPGVKLDAKGRVQVDPKTHRTGHPKVWSGGDCVNGGKEVVNAVQEAKIAVRDMLLALEAR